ncbi:MAG: acyltransferase family protein [Bacteroidaceae bacterium]|nr:acyltransferase family protein [Bacteroidaceae bacterium]
MKTIANRLDWIDWAKCIAIFLVVFGHMRSPYMGYIFSFHMPFFFLISGFLQKKRPVVQELTNSVKCLLVPYILFNIYLLIYSYFTGEYNAEYPLSMVLGLQWNLSMACRPLWFLWALFFSRLLFTALPRKVAQFIAIPIMILCFFMNGTEWMKAETNYFQLWTVAECYPFFALGSLVKDYKVQNLDKKLHPVFSSIILIGIFITAAYFTTMNGGVNIFRCHPGDNALLFYLTAGLMSLSLFILTSIVFHKANKNIQLISEGTLLIFAVHQSILWPLHEHLSHGLVSFLVAVGLITVFCPFISLCKKYAPVLIGKWK